MASILRVNTLTDASSNNSIATSNIFSGTAKCWGGASNAAVIADSFNIASSTDDGTGQYTHNLSNALDQDINNVGGNACVHGDNGIARYFGSSTASAAKIRCLNDSFTDTDHVHAFAIHGDLA